jgi:hypothetical protein
MSNKDDIFAKDDLIDAVLFAVCVLGVGLTCYLILTELPAAIDSHLDTLAWMVER